MPLRDHFRPPISDLTSWDGLHGGWPMVMVLELGASLPAGYVAEPRVHLGAQAEIDVAAFDEGTARGGFLGPADTGSADVAWAPAEPTLAVETELANFDEYEMRVYDVRRGRRLVAAVEIISPSNKDRAENCHQYTSKCAALLRQGVSLVLVDLVTVRNFNLYGELLQLIGEKDPTVTGQPASIYATACRWRPHGKGRWLEAWNCPLAVGQPLPRLPLWLAEDLAIPLDLEASYEKTCRGLRIP